MPRFTRRALLRAGAAAGVGAAAFGTRRPRTALAAPTPLDPLTQPKFRMPLPIMPYRAMLAGGSLSMAVKPGLAQTGIVDAAGNALSTPIFGYEGIWPGPSIVAKQGAPLAITWRNELVDANGAPLPHILPVDVTIIPDELKTASGEYDASKGVPHCSHRHGGVNRPETDGGPMAWVTPDPNVHGVDYRPDPGTPEHTTFLYENAQEGAPIWYHEHAMGFTRANVMAGVAGGYVIVDDNQLGLIAANRLPALDHSIPLVIQDRMFTSDGRLFVPSDSDVAGAPSPSISPEFEGDHMVVNGAIWPVLTVEPRPYRFWIWNGCDSRFLALRLDADVRQIGGDLGLLNAPVEMRTLVLGPGERADIVVDFTAANGSTLVWRNNAAFPFGDAGTAPDPLTTGRVMAFRVRKPFNRSIPRAKLPQQLRPAIGPVPTLRPSAPARKVLLWETVDEFGRTMPILGTPSRGGLPFMADATETPRHGTTEVWEIYNSTMDTHPMHLHGAVMRLVDREAFVARQDDATGILSNIVHSGHRTAPALNERGLKDTVQCPPGVVTRVACRFDIPGTYVWHCHILSHEEHDMMRPLVIL